MKPGTYVRHNRETNTLELYVYENGNSYDILVDDCDTYKALVWWINHMTRKTWFDADVLRAFLDAWEKATGLSASGDPLSAKED